MRDHNETRYRERGGVWLYGAGFVLSLACSIFFMTAYTEYENGWLVVAMGVGWAIWTLWYGIYYVYEWTLREDGLIETRALFRHRVEAISRVEHDKDGDFDHWFVSRAGARYRIHLSKTSGAALANALRARDAPDLVDDPEPPPSKWWHKVLDMWPD